MPASRKSNAPSPPRQRHRRKPTSKSAKARSFSVRASKQFALPIPLQMVSPHEGEAIPVEHETDVDEKNAVAGAPVKKFLFQQFAQAAPESPLIQPAIMREVL